MTTKEHLALPNVCAYEGELRKGLPHGLGVMVIPKVGKYEGQFRKGLFHGPGVFTAAKGWRFAGWWRRGVPHGPGAFLDGGANYAGANETFNAAKWPWYSGGVTATLGRR